MSVILSVSPFECRLWDLHDRNEHAITEETCRAEIQSFAKHGQRVPALGRLLAGDSEHKYELIYGARRLFVARHLNKPLLVEICDMSDRECIVAMDIENRQRADVSPYERGFSYLRWLRSGQFSSQEELAQTLRVSASQVSRLMKLAQLPAVIVDAFPEANAICEGWGLDLLSALDDPERRQRTINLARRLGQSWPRPPAREVYRQLLSAGVRGRRVRSGSHDEVVVDLTGAPLFRIRHQQRSVALMLPRDRVSGDVLEALRHSIREILVSSSRAAF